MILIKERNHPFKETEGFSWKQVVMALTDPLVWLASVSLFCASIALFGFGTFLPTLLKGLNIPHPSSLEPPPTSQTASTAEPSASSTPHY
ncbi:hypothetical protein LB505_013571 [Fusarium chuoi]|nr:hypothetical protein LB505_013571 [Fusarium chuoi]